MTDTQSDLKKARQIAFIYIKVMLFAFTGGNMTLPLLHQQLSDRYKLIDRDKITEYFALGQSIPGIISVNSGIFIGREIAGITGAVGAVFGCVFPAFTGMLLITFSYTFLQQFDFIAKAVTGIRVAAIAIILGNGIALSRSEKSIFAVCVAVFAFTATFIFGWNIVIVIISGGFAGVVREFIKVRRGNKNDF